MIFRKWIMLIVWSICAIEVSGQKIVEDPFVEVRESGSFKSVKIHGNLQVWISQDASEAVAVSADDVRGRQVINTMVKDSVLHVTGGRGRKKGRGRVYISFKTLERLDIDGIVSVNAVGSVRQAEFSLSVAGVSDFTGSVSVENFNASVSGVSNVIVSGRTESAHISCVGTSRFEGSDFSVNKCRLSASGVSVIEAGVIDELTVTASGSTKVSIFGNPARIHKDLSGSAVLELK